MKTIDNAIVSHAVTQQPWRQARRLFPSAVIKTWLFVGWDYVAYVARVRQGRRQLAGLDSRLLADIGASRADAMAEAARPWWSFGPPPPDATRHRR